MLNAGSKGHIVLFRLGAVEGLEANISNGLEGK
jgi:hypothetical protein